MAHDAPVPGSFSPPKARSGGGAVRWAVTLIALLALVVMAWQAYAWYAGDVTRREALATRQALETVGLPPPAEVAGLAMPDSAPGNVPIAVADPGDVDDPDQRRALCGYLAAELERLNSEFKQPLPPPVIDRIATEITRLGEQNSRYGCVVPAEPGAARHGRR
jgi:hypothetical protein